MARRTGLVTGLVAGAVVVAAVAGGVAVAQLSPSPAGVGEVARLVPAGVTAVDVTAWASVRERFDATGEQLVETASTRDLASRSTLVVSGEVVTDDLG